MGNDFNKQKAYPEKKMLENFDKKIQFSIPLYLFVTYL